jgi:hypothetical protein
MTPLRHLGSLFDVVSFNAPKESCGPSKNLRRVANLAAELD